jgi:hypothetical protein
LALHSSPLAGGVSPILVPSFLKFSFGGHWTFPALHVTGQKSFGPMQSVMPPWVHALPPFPLEQSQAVLLDWQKSLLVTYSPLVLNAGTLQAFSFALHVLASNGQSI